MKPDEIAIAAGALSSAVAVLIEKGLLTRQEAAAVSGKAMGRVKSLRGKMAGADAALILSRLGQIFANGN